MIILQSRFYTDPLDFIFSKLLRGTEEDFRDIFAVIRKYGITKEGIIERGKLIRFPKDAETLFFKKKMQYLLNSIG